MSRLDDVSARIADQLPDLIAKYHVPAAAVAVDVGGEVIDHAAGVLNRATGVEATTDSLFQVGSITKVWTASLVMRLVEDGALDLDEPIRNRLPEFQLADDTAAARVTIRHLLSHTAGFEGDFLDVDTGTGDDCLAKFLPELADAESLFAPGQMFSYNNAGYSVLGRLIEVVREIPYDQCLKEDLIDPLGLTHVAPSPYQAVMYRVAHGHVGSETDPVPAPMWTLYRSSAPAGAMLAMRPRDLLGFVRGHLTGQVPGAETMRERQIDVPLLGGHGTAWCLGWELFDWPGGPVVGHDGDTIGQAAYLRVVPDRDVAVAVFTNGGAPRELFTEIGGLVLRDLAGVDVPAPLEPIPGERVTAADRYLGVYTSRVADRVVSQDPDGRVWVDWTPKGVFAEMGAEPSRRELVPVRGDTLASAEKVGGDHQLYTFVGAGPDGHATHLHTGRADPWRPDRPAGSDDQAGPT